MTYRETIYDPCWVCGREYPLTDNYCPACGIEGWGRSL